MKITAVLKFIPPQGVKQEFSGISTWEPKNYLASSILKPIQDLELDLASIPPHHITFLCEITFKAPQTQTVHITQVTGVNQVNRATF